MKDQFQPPRNERIYSVQEQIAEIKKMIWRNELEARIEKDTEAGNHVQAEAEYNNTQLKAKLEVLVNVLGELEKEEE